MESTSNDLLRGALDLLILKVLSTSELHGWDISKRIHVVSGDRILVKQGSLYPALHRLELKNFIDSEWGVSEAGRSAKFYRLTKKGKAQLEREVEAWLSFADSVSSILSLKGVD